MIERYGIKSPGKLSQEMVEVGISSQLTSQFINHEYYGHAANDEVGKGEFGFAIGGGYIVAYYFIIGDRTPEQRMKIAAGPGFGEMSDQDWNLYNQAWKEWLEEQRKEKFENLKSVSDKLNKNESESPYDLSLKLVDKFAEELNKLEKDGRFPSFDQLIKMSMKELFEKYGIAIKWAYLEALNELENVQIDAAEELKDGDI